MNFQNPHFYVNKKNSRRGAQSLMTLLLRNEKKFYFFKCYYNLSIHMVKWAEFFPHIALFVYHTFVSLEFKKKINFLFWAMHQKLTILDFSSFKIPSKLLGVYNKFNIEHFKISIETSHSI